MVDSRTLKNIDEAIRCANEALLAEVMLRFRDDVFARAREIDPTQSRDWEDLALGYLIAMGADPTDMVTIAVALKMSLGLQLHERVTRGRRLAEEPELLAERA